MPIIVRPAADDPLTQGDILKGVPLFVTRSGWVEGVAHKAPSEFCLVVTRPCGIAHKKHVTVAALAKYPDSQPKGIASFEDVLTFITGARDGLTSPDVFHIGQIAELGGGRYCARLDSLHVIEIPTDKTVMTTFLAEKRVATLHIDFARSLHVRLFNAFASLGFEDYAWPSDADLEWLVTQGKKDIAALEAAALQIKADRLAKVGEGKQVGDEKEVTSAENKTEQLRDQVRPYENELERRKAARTLPRPVPPPE